MCFAQQGGEFIRGTALALLGDMQVNVSGSIVIGMAEPVHDLLQWDAGRLVEEKLKPARTTAAMAEAFGRGLAFTHAAGAKSFGCGPDGWDATEPGWRGWS